MSKLNIEFMDDTCGFYSKVEDDLESSINRYLDRYVISDMPWDEMGKEEFEQLFPDREFLFAWYPFEYGAKILEIGGGVGAVTGFLCKVAQKVTTIEKKKSRAEIIRKRFKELRNLEVINCNYFDYTSAEKFDYVVVHDIFGYVKKYTKNQKPYEQLINHLLSLLSVDGKILLATENRLGIKYFSGAIEDYSNKYFIGLDSFDGYDVIYTPTKNELKDLLNRCGIKNYRFYYPFPDNVFPIEIYTDESMEFLLYGGRSEETGWDRFELYDEREMLETLQRDGIVDNFVNAFFIEIGKQNNLSNIIYSRLLNRDKDRDFQVAGIKADQYYDLDGNKFSIKGSISLQKKISSLFFEVKRNDMSVNEFHKRIGNIFKTVKQALEQVEQVTDNIYTEKFLSRFGDLKLNNVNGCVNFCEIGTWNIFCREDAYLFSFKENELKIPLDYMMWLIIYEWYKSNVWGRKSRMKLVDLNEIYESCSLRKEDIQVFKEWRNNSIKETSRKMVEAHYVNWYKQDFIYPVDATVNGDLIMKNFVIVEEEDSQLMKEKAVLDEIR